MAQQAAPICVKRNNRGAAKRIANKAMSRHASTTALAIVSSVCVVMLRHQLGDIKTLNFEPPAQKFKKRVNLVLFLSQSGFRGCTKNVRKATSASVTLYYEQTLPLSLVDLRRSSCVIFAKLCGRGS
jgi:hypothetical protein